MNTLYEIIFELSLIIDKYSKERVEIHFYKTIYSKQDFYTSTLYESKIKTGWKEEFGSEVAGRHGHGIALLN